MIKQSINYIATSIVEASGTGKAKVKISELVAILVFVMPIYSKNFRRILNTTLRRIEFTMLNKLRLKHCT